MFVLRTLFWFAVVALLMPHGPDLGFGLSRVRSDLATYGGTTRLVSLSDAKSPLEPILASDPVQAFRDAVGPRLSVIRAELSAPAKGLEREGGPRGAQAPVPY